MRNRWATETRLLTLCGAMAIAGCQPDAPEEPVVNEPAEEASPRPPLPLAEPPMDRAGLLQAVARAASAAALGREDAEQQRALDGRRFEVRIRFGCTPGGGTPNDAAPFNLRFNEEDRTLRVRAAPDLTLEDAQIAALAGPEIEAVEGFWMNRPWLLTDGCPARPPQPAPPAPGTAEDPAETRTQADAAELPATSARQRVGLAQFFTKTDPRTGRRDERAFEATKVLAADEQPSPQGYNLVLSGRLRRAPQGRVIACRLVNADAPPECVVSAEFDRTWIERPDTKAIVAEWTG